MLLERKADNESLIAIGSRDCYPDIDATGT
jgi:hypothetical protein